MKVHIAYCEHHLYHEGGRKLHVTTNGYKPVCGTPSAWRGGGYCLGDALEITKENFYIIPCLRCREIIRKRLGKEETR
jgi:hypothetical protein